MIKKWISLAVVSCFALAGCDPYTNNPVVDNVTIKQKSPLAYLLSLIGNDDKSQKLNTEGFTKAGINYVDEVTLPLIKTL